MLAFTRGSLLEAESEALVNTVNTVGVMGKGVALQFKQAFPDNYAAYRAACARDEVQLGRMFIFDRETLEKPRYIVNFPTKRHWKGKSRIEDIEAGLSDLHRVVVDLEIQSIALPAVGCGNGGLDWRDIKPLIEAYLGDLEASVTVFEPVGPPPPQRMRIGTKRPRMTPGRAALVGLLGRYLEPGFGASMLEVQKLLYLLQVAGEELKLSFVKGPYGPYADAVNHVLQALEGHYLRGYGDRSRGGEAHLLEGAADEAEEFLKLHPETRARFDRVLELIEGFESPYGLELLTTAHWVALQEDLAPDDLDAAVGRIQTWNARKKKLFTRDHVARAWRRLTEQGWLDRSKPAAHAY